MRRLRENLLIYEKFSQDMKEDARIENGMRGLKRKCKVKHSRSCVNRCAHKGTLENTRVKTRVINVTYDSTLVNTCVRGVTRLVGIHISRVHKGDGGKTCVHTSGSNVTHDKKTDSTRVHKGGDVTYATKPDNTHVLKGGEGSTRVSTRGYNVTHNQKSNIAHVHEGSVTHGMLEHE